MDRAAERAKFRDELIAEWLEGREGSTQAEAEEHADAMLAALDKRAAYPDVPAHLLPYLPGPTVNGEPAPAGDPLPQNISITARVENAAELTPEEVAAVNVVSALLAGEKIHLQPAPLDAGRWERKAEPDEDNDETWEYGYGSRSCVLGRLDNYWRIGGLVDAEDLEAAARIIRHHQEQDAS